MAKPRTLLRTVGSISFATSISRVLGFVREMVQAYFFGAGMVVDAFVTAFRIPNLLRDLFAEGALSAAFVPTFTREKERNGREAAWMLARRMITGLILVLGILSVLIVVFAPALVRLYAPGFDDPEKIALTVTMTRILSPFLLFVALAAVAMGMLNSLGKFFIPALSPAAFNVATIAGVILLVPALTTAGIHPGLSLAIGGIVGGALQFFVQVPSARAEGFRYRPVRPWPDPAVRHVLHLMVPAIFGLAATQINILVDNILASMQGEGPISWLSYAFRLKMLPMGVFGVAIATANMARVAHDAARDDLVGMRANLAAALRAAAFLTIPSTAGLIALSVPIVRVLLERGMFGPEDTRMTAAAVICYAIGIAGQSAVKILVPTYYAIGNTRLPVIATFWTVATKIVASFALIALFPRIGIAAFLGLALATSFAGWVNFGVLYVAIRRHLGSFAGTGVVSATARMVIISVVMGFATAGLHGFLERHLPLGGFAGEVARLSIAMAAGVAIVALGSLALRVPEATAFARRLRRRNGDDE